VREIAFDKADTAEHRANAILAYAKLQAFPRPGGPGHRRLQGVVRRGQRSEGGRGVCRAACLIVRQARGTIYPAVELLADWKANAPGAFKNTLELVRLDYAKFTQFLSEMAAKRITPDPFPTALPAWVPGRPGGGALNFPNVLAAPPAFMAVRPNVGPSALQMPAPGAAVPGRRCCRPSPRRPGLPKTLAWATCPP